MFWGVERYNMAEVKRRFRRTRCFHHLCPGASNFCGMSVKFHTKSTCPTALTASNSTHRTYSKSAFSACLALSKFTCHNCHLTEPDCLVLLTLLVLCFLYDVKTNVLCGGLFRPPIGDILSATKPLVFSYEIRYRISLQKFLTK